MSDEDLELFFGHKWFADFKVRRQERDEKKRLKAEAKKKREEGADERRANKNKRRKESRELFKQEHPEEYQAKRDEVNARRRERRRRFKEDCPEEYRIKRDEISREQKAKRKKDPEKFREYEKKYRKNNPEKIRQSGANYRSKHPDKVAEKKSKRRATKKNATLSTTNPKEMAVKYTQAQIMSKVSLVKHEVDHIIPLAIGGAHHQDNLRVITAKENNKKRSKYIPELGGVWADSDLARKTKKKLGIK